MHHFFSSLSEDYQEAFLDIEKWLIQMNGLRRVKFDQMIKIHIAPRSDLCKCYTNTQLFESHIFFNNIPREDEGVQKFFMFHEIAHVFVRMLTQPIELTIGLTAYMFYLFWIAISINWTSHSMIVVAAFVLAMTIWRGEYKQRAKTGFLLDEIMADCMAINYLSQKDLEKVSQNRRISILLWDKKLTPLHNSIRLAKLRENIERVIKGETDQVFENIFLGYLPEADITFLFAAVLLVLIPSFYARVPSGGDLIRAVVIALFFGLLFIASTFLYSAADSILKEKLAYLFPQCLVNKEDSTASS